MTDSSGGSAPKTRHDRKRTALAIVLVIVGLLVALAVAYASVKLFNPRAFDVEVFDEKGQGRVIPGGALFP